MFKNHLKLSILTRSFLKFCWSLNGCTKHLRNGGPGNGCAEVFFTSKTWAIQGTSRNFQQLRLQPYLRLPALGCRVTLSSPVGSWIYWQHTLLLSAASHHQNSELVTCLPFPCRKRLGNSWFPRDESSGGWL